MDRSSRRIIASAHQQVRESELLIERARGTVEATYRRLSDGKRDDPYLSFVSLQPGAHGRGSDRNSLHEEAIARVAISEQLIAIARKLIQTSRTRRLSRGGGAGRTSDAPVSDQDTSGAS